MSGRGKPGKDRLYCWQEKTVRRKIREVFDADGRKASALGIYDALTEIASNEKSDTFTKSHDYIASFAGLTGKTSKRIMPIFEKMGIVHVQPNGSDGLQQANTYTLLPWGLKVPTQGQERKSDLSHVLNKSGEESEEKSDDNSKRTLGNSLAVNQSNAPGESLSIHFSSLEEAKKHPHWKKFEAYCGSQNGNPALKGFNTWNSKQPPPKPNTNVTKHKARYEAWLKASEDKADADRILAASEKRLGYVPVEQMLKEVRKVFPNATEVAG